MKVKKCKRCGEEFIAKGKAIYCNKEKTEICPICGKHYIVTCNSSAPNTCGDSNCIIEYSKKKREESASKEIRICKWCRRPFQPKSVRDVYCREIHYQTCVICGKEFEIDVRKDSTVKTCSAECKHILMVNNTDREQAVATQKKSMMKKYGVDNPMKIPGAIEKLKATNQEKYGADWYTQTDEYKERVESTSMEKYGTSHFLQNQDVIAKREQTCLEKYGVDNVSKVHEVQDKIRQTWQDKYGIQNVSQRHIHDMEAWNSFKAQPCEFINKTFNDASPTMTELKSALGVCTASVYNVLMEHDLIGILKHEYSSVETEICEFINDLSNTEVVNNDRTIIKPFELDIYIPQYEFAIECNPTYTHNSSIQDPWGQPAKSPSYHKMKTDMCEEKGIQLLHIFGYQWTHKQDIVKSMIRNALKCNVRKVYARNCEVREVSYNDCKEFLERNHIQGNVSSKWRFGLYLNDELVSVMTFGRSRNTIGSSKNEDLSDSVELLRFCSVLNTTVVGGASKLFKHAVQTLNPSRIRSFSHRAHTSGGIYPILGFEMIRMSEPGYMWVDLETDKAYHRYNAQKQNIQKFLKDNTIDLSLSESEIMESHGYVRVYDSGTITWEWNNR